MLNLECAAVVQHGELNCPTVRSLRLNDDGLCAYHAYQYGVHLPRWVHSVFGLNVLVVIAFDQ